MRNSLTQDPGSKDEPGHPQKAGGVKPLLQSDGIARMGGKRDDGASRRSGGEEHVGGLEALALAIVDIEDEVVLEDIIARGVAKIFGGAVDGVGGTFELDVGTDGSLVEVDDEIPGPFLAGRKLIGSAVFFVSEPTFEAESFEDLLEGGGVGQDHLGFFADFVATAGVVREFTDGELLGRGFEGEDHAGSGFAGGPLLFSGGCRGFGADAKELTVLGEAAVGCVEDHVVLVDAGGGRLGPELGESAEKRFGIGDVEFDFGFARHVGIV